MRRFCIAFLALLLITGCTGTEGTLKLRGSVIDEETKAQIPGREMFVQGLLERDNKIVPVDAGYTSTDSSGCFMFLLKKIKDARYYNFCIVGDSDYASSVNRMSIYQLKGNPKYISFPLHKFVGLKIHIRKFTRTVSPDTLYLTWESDNIDYRTLYPYQVKDSGIPGDSQGQLSGIGLRWIGGNINTVIKTKVLAGKKTIIHWELVRNKISKEFSDTILCQRDIGYNFDLEY